MERPNAWKTYKKNDLKKVEQTAAEYRKFLDHGKTERECAAETVEMLEKAGYIPLQRAIEAGKKLKPGDRIYVNQMGKAVLIFLIGKNPLETGMNIVGAHIDSPRLDLKQNPLYEDNDFAMADTHYYGGVKKYQWVARELALHGVVAKKDGTVVNICIGENENDPVIGITDLLIHLSQEQMKKTLGEAISGEKLDIMMGGKPLADTEKEPVKPVPPTGGAYVVSANGKNVNLRAAPTTRSTVIRSYKVGTKLTIITRGVDWCFVLINGTYGYMMRQFIYDGAALATITDLHSTTAF